MDDREVGQYWEANAPVWTRLARAGYDIYRDHLNTPAFLAMLPEVRGLEGLDIGCGEGHNTRQVAQRGARMTAIDIAPSFVAAASEEERRQPLGIRYQVATALELPFADGSFDFATAFMSMMDLPGQQRAVAEAHRVLRPGGFFQFSICHPCFQTDKWGWVLDEGGQRLAVTVGDYFTPRQGRVDSWIFTATPAELRRTLEPFHVPRFPQTLAWWINTLLDTGFVLERVGEPRAGEETVKACPALADTQIVAYFLHVRCRKA